MLFLCDVLKIITVVFLRQVLNEYLVLSGHSDVIVDVWPCVKLIVPLVVCEIIMVKGLHSSFLLVQ